VAHRAEGLRVEHSSDAGGICRVAARQPVRLGCAAVKLHSLRCAQVSLRDLGVWMFLICYRVSRMCMLQAPAWTMRTRWMPSWRQKRRRRAGGDLPSLLASRS
jgi:hypothetical protein